MQDNSSKCRQRQNAADKRRESKLRSIRSRPEARRRQCGAAGRRGHRGPLIERKNFSAPWCDAALTNHIELRPQLKVIAARRFPGWPMSTYRLDKLFAPRSIAVVGASPRATSPGRAVLQNLRDAGFQGSIHLVNPHYDEIGGIGAVKPARALPEPPDLVVIAAPARSVPEIVVAAGEKGAAAAIIITAGLGHGEGSLAEACRRAARATGLRLV